jgi:hypothetical protein
MGDGVTKCIKEFKFTEILGLTTVIDYSKKNTWWINSLDTKGTIRGMYVFDKNDGLSDPVYTLHLSPYAVERISMMEKKYFPSFLVNTSS